jgi:hypothetical protein
MSELALRLIEENKRTRATFLDLGNCGLTEVPEEIGELVWLEALSFSKWWNEIERKKTQNNGCANNIRSLIPLVSSLNANRNPVDNAALTNPFSKLKNLKRLWLNGDNSVLFGLSDLSDLSPLAELFDLQELYVSYTKVTDLAPVSKLSCLQKLDISQTLVSDLTALTNLTCLQSLNTSYTKIDNLTPLSGLLSLEALYASRTSISDLSALAGLAALQWLLINDTKVTDLSPISGLMNLQWLEASHTQVNDLTPLSKLIRLQGIKLSNTLTTNLAPLTKLLLLHFLIVSQTSIADLAPLSDLNNLQTLNISQTQVDNLNPLSKLTRLRTLDISRTNVYDLSPLLPLIKLGVLVKWSKWESYGIFVQDCQLTNPPTYIVQQGNEAILRYFAEKVQSKTIKVREAKLLLVGQGKAGKTTLKNKLHDTHAEMPAPGDTTRGIEITRLNEKMPQTGEPLRINVWDFGGQDIQHYAHQFFLTGNSLYALVTNERRQDSVHLPYWLNIIEMLGKKSPILLIQNKDGGHCQPLRDEAAIRARFGNVHNRVFQTDLSQAATELEFADLRREIIHQAAQLPHVEREYLASFAELRDKLEAEADRQTHYLRWEVYLTLMPELSEDLMRDYANALTFLGVCQYFPDDAMLSAFVFLRPKWIIDALFALLLHPSLEAKRGHFSERDTFEIWQGAEYKGMHALLVRMMEEFELCYRVEGSGHSYILPQRLPGENRSYGWDEPHDTPVQYRYKFMPKGILTRLICRLHPRIEADPERGQRVWCDAVIFALPDGKGRVFAREVYSENTIELRAAGSKRAEMLNEVIRKMDDINRDAKYDNLQVDKLVPCPCEECVRAEAPRFHEYEALQKRIEKGKTTSECKKSGEDVPIDEIFGKSGVKKPATRWGDRFYPEPEEADTVLTLKIFISYSHAQRDYFPIFKADFTQYAQFPSLAIDVFGDDEIPLGAVWDEYLQDKVANCDAIILLVSREFMNSAYIQEKEFGAAVERLKAGRELLIAPIYFAPCQFDSDVELAKLQFFKPHGERFDKAQKGDSFSYIDLVKFRESDGLAIPNSNRKHYMMALMKKMEPSLQILAKTKG